jgi:hypothetical protein
MKMNFRKGEIIYGRKNSDAEHPILFLEDKDNLHFIGVMLTSKKRNKNISLPKEYIIKQNENNESYEFQYMNTHFVNARLLKKNKWEPFRKIGEITPEGIEFVEQNIIGKDEESWEDYLDNQGNE